MITKKISPTEVEATIAKAGSRFFSVTFVKRTDNSIREMNCRRGVKKGVKGGGRKTRKPGLLSVYDMVEKGFRTINLSGVKRVRIAGVEYRVTI